MFFQRFHASAEDPYTIRVLLTHATLQGKSAEIRRLQRIWKSFTADTRQAIEAVAGLGG